MAKPIYSKFVQTSAGAADPSASFTVVNEETGLDVDIYSDRAGTTVITPPYFADSSGLIRFYYDEGITIRIAVTGASGSFTDRYQEGRVFGGEPGNSPRILDFQVDSISQLPPATGSGRKVSVTGYHAGTTVGGSEFVDAGLARHDGGKYIDPSRAFPTDWTSKTQRDAWYADSGVDVPCWELIDDNKADPANYGAFIDGSISASEAWQKAADYSASKYVPFVFDGEHKLETEVVFTGRQDILGKGPASSRIINRVSDTSSCLKFVATSGFYPNSTHFTIADFFIQDETNLYGTGIYFDTGLSWVISRNVIIIGGKHGFFYTKFCIGHFHYGVTCKAQAVSGVQDTVQTTYAEHNVGLSIIGGNYEQSPVCIDWHSDDLALSGQPIIEAYTDAGVRTRAGLFASSGYFEPIADNTTAIDLIGAGTYGSSITGTVMHLNSTVGAIGIHYESKTNIAFNDINGDTGAGSFALDTNSPTASMIFANTLTTLNIAADTTATYATNGTYQGKQITAESFGRFGVTPMSTFGSFEPTTNEVDSIGTENKKYNQLWTKQVIPVQVAFYGFVAATSVNNNTLFIDSADSKLKFKDSTGTVNLLY